MGIQLSYRVENIVGKGEIALTSNFFFSPNVFKSSLLLMHQNEYVWSKGLTIQKKRAFENSGKRENTANHHFLSFLQCFLCFHRKKKKSYLHSI